MGGKQPAGEEKRLQKGGYRKVRNLAKQKLGPHGESFSENGLTEEEQLVLKKKREDEKLEMKQAWETHGEGEKKKTALTEIQQQIIDLAKEGKYQGQIAKELQISGATMSYHAAKLRDMGFTIEKGKRMPAEKPPEQEQPQIEKPQKSKSPRSPRSPRENIQSISSLKKK